VEPLRPLNVELAGVNLIEASAGTGKTWTITTLYLRMLLERRIAVANVLVVTFTRAATAELKDRVRARLRRAVAAFGGAPCRDDPDLAALVEARRGRYDAVEDRRVLQTALRSFDEAPILTLHSFCQRMLHQHAFESGVRFDTELITSQQDVVDEIAYDFWGRTAHEGTSAAWISALEAGGITPFKLRSLAAVVARRPDTKLLPVAELDGEPDESAGQRQPEQVALIDGARAPDILGLKRDFVRYVREELPRRKRARNVEAFDDLIRVLRDALEGGHGDLLSKRISEHFQAVLIDEFQDTDPAQYEIFRRVYRGVDACVFLIGDPKQSIYAFRSADVFAYMRAKADAAGRVYTLDTNWRSDPALVGAVNFLFGRLERPFLFEQHLIGYHHVKTHNAQERLVFPQESPLRPGVELLFVPRNRKTTRKRNVISSYWAERFLPDLIAGEIAGLLVSEASIEGRPIAAGDVAVLVATNAQAKAIQDALRAVGVPSALMGRASVLETQEASEVARVLTAVVSPRSRRRLRSALATRLLGLTAAELVALEDDPEGWQLWVGRFEAWRDDWNDRGFFPSFRRLLVESGVGSRLLGWSDGERRLTNYRHLGELIGRVAARRKLDAPALAGWFARALGSRTAVEEFGEEAAQLRLERDADSVTVVTTHRAKGLEYPVVYCPYLWMGRLLMKEEEEYPRFHDAADDNRLSLDLAADRRSGSLKAARREALAENLRVAYVAITRACHRCTVVWGPFDDAHKSPLAYLLHAPISDSANPAYDAAKAVLLALNSGGDDALIARVEELCAASKGVMSVRMAGEAGAGDLVLPGRAAVELVAPPPVPRVARRWRRTSFSGLTSGVDHLHPPSGEAANDPGDSGDDHGGRVLLADFPRGTDPGSLVHEVLEDLDFKESSREVLEELVAEKLLVWGVDACWGPMLSEALDQMLDVPLPTAKEPMPLRALGRVDRLDEMSFVLPLGRGAEPLTLSRVADALEAYGNVPSTYPDEVRQLPADPARGFLTGFLDLVFRWQGRWYVIDYKTNHLGDFYSDYGEQGLESVMAEHHYYLQYHFYTVALHRHLTQRLPGYDYERDFGGALYLFIRGLGPDGRGVYFDRPQRALLDALGAALEGDPG
jgi:exodeoxyribonuclease V beta subunit